MITFAVYAVVEFLDEHVTPRRAATALLIAAIGITLLVLR